MDARANVRRTRTNGTDGGTNSDWPAQLGDAVAACTVRPMNLRPLAEVVQRRVRTLRDFGEPPERVLVAIRADVVDALYRAGGSHATSTVVARVRRQVVDWCVAAYYDTPGRPQTIPPRAD